jgi:hypothetical protein
MYRSKLPQASVAALKGFVEYLIDVEGKSPNTARAYQSWAAKYMAQRGTTEPHVLSAAKAFSRFVEAKK